MIILGVRDMCLRFPDERDIHPRLGGISVRYMPFGGGGPKLPPAPSPVPRKVTIDVAAAEKEQREIASRRRSRSRSALTAGMDFGVLETAQSELLGL